MIPSEGYQYSINRIMTTKQKQKKIVDTAASAPAPEDISVKAEDRLVAIATIDTGDNI